MKWFVKFCCPWIITRREDLAVGSLTFFVTVKEAPSAEKKSLCTVDLETCNVLMFRIGLVSYATVVSIQNRLLECLNYFFCKWFFCLFILKVIVGYKENMINIFDRDLTFDHNKILY